MFVCHLKNNEKPLTFNNLCNKIDTWSKDCVLFKKMLDNEDDMVVLAIVPKENINWIENTLEDVYKEIQKGENKIYEKSNI